MFDNKALDVASYQHDVELGEAMDRLENNPDFIAVFQTKFIEDFAVTNTMLVSSYDQATRQRTFEKMVGRSIFTQFLMGVKQDAEFAKQALIEINRDATEEAQDDFGSDE